MRVLHISTYDTGGAARSARNLVEGQRRRGYDARMLVREKSSTVPWIVPWEARGPEILKRQKQASLIQRKLINPYRTNISNTWFSIPWPGFNLAGHPEAQAADVIHLHWVAGFLGPGSIRELQALGKPVLWTLHDQRPFTGGCHFSAGCARFERDCESCPQLGSDRWRIPAIALEEALGLLDRLKLVVVSPSRWMTECARRSVVMGRCRIETIPYGIDTDMFKPTRSAVRQELGIDASAKMLLTGADAAGELRKGLHLLDAALHKSFGDGNNAHLHVVAFGAPQAPAGFSYPVRWLGRINSTARLAELYSAADAFLLPSTEDNLPNTMIEALCCGTPVIAFDIGGVPDCINEGNGLLVRPVTAEAFAEALKTFCDAPGMRERFNRHAIAEAAAKQLNLQTQAEGYIDLYRSVLANWSCSGALASPPPTTTGAGHFEAAFEELARHAARERWKARWLRLGRRLSLGLARK